LETPLRRILVVEDYEPFRSFISSTLRKEPGFRVCEVADGLVAVRKAEELQPELILLDIGLPSLNGIGAARRIRKVSPDSKILFVSQQSSTEVVREALALGALGYVVKVHAGTELLPAVEAVLQGRQFISAGLSGLAFSPAVKAKTLDSSTEPLHPRGPAGQDPGCCHQVEFYSDEAGFVGGFTRFIETALTAGTAVISVVTESHQTSILQKLREHGVDVAAAVEKGRYVALNVADVLSAFMVNDVPDPVRFLKVATNRIASTAKASSGASPSVALCGECAPILWQQGKTDAAMEVERLCGEVARTCAAELLCGYVLSAFQSEEKSRIFERIRARHSAVPSN
jgi:DNA-binding NarL/FixJ family response regulator